MDTIFTLIKIFEKKEFADTFRSGRLYMNTIESFKNWRDESGELRGDEYEGIIALLQPDKIKIKIDNKEVDSRDLATPIVFHNDSLLKKNAFCMYSLTSTGYSDITEENIEQFKKTREMHNSCYGLGEYCVVLTNIVEFKKRCIQAIRNNRYEGKLSLVKYFDTHSHHGRLPEKYHGFQKRSFYSHQKEYRILLDTNQAENGPIFFDIGNIEDISFIMKTEDFNNKLEFELPDTENAKPTD